MRLNPRRNPYPFVPSYIVSAVMERVADRPPLLDFLQRNRDKYLDYARIRLQEAQKDPSTRAKMLTLIANQRIAQGLEMAKGDKREFSDIMAIALGADAKRLGFSLSDLSDWISTHYGDIWVKSTDLNPEMDLSEVIVRAKKAWTTTRVRSREEEQEDAPTKQAITQYGERKRAGSKLDELIDELIEQEREGRYISRLDISTIHGAGRAAYGPVSDSQEAEEAARMAIVDALGRYTGNPRR